MNVKRLRRDNEGITLIALVVTIIVLLILAGITINLLFNDTGLFNKVQEAKNIWENAEKNDKDRIEKLTENMKNMLNEMSSESSTTILEKLEIGSTISYTPSGTYNWKMKYCSSDLTNTEDNILLNSDNSEDYNISTWRVLSIDKDTETVELVPTMPTIGSVYLAEAQGYNNGVKLLNDACNNLYGNNSKGITARSISIEDIEKYMTDKALIVAHEYKSEGSNTKYNNQINSPYTINNKYPVIYAQEKLATIDEKISKEKGLKISEQEIFIEREEGVNGLIETATSIQPYQTYWHKDNSFMFTAFNNYTKNNSEIANYYDIIMPKGKDTNYWIASRCITNDYMVCGFCINVINHGGVDAEIMCGSGGSIYNASYGLFPVVSLNANLIEEEPLLGFKVK